MNPELGMKAQEMVYGEIGDFAEDMMVQGPDYYLNRAKPENMPGDDPSEPGVTFSEGDMMALEGEYGSGCATKPTNY